MRQLQSQVQAFELERDLALHAGTVMTMRLALLPLEHAPQIVEAASEGPAGTNLSIATADGA